MKRKMCLGGGLLLIASSAIISLAACSSFNLHSDNVIRNVSEEQKHITVNGNRTFKYFDPASDTLTEGNYLIGGEKDSKLYFAQKFAGKNNFPANVAWQNSDSECEVFKFSKYTQDPTKWVIQDSINNYLYAASSSKNYLKTQTTLNMNGCWDYDSKNSQFVAQGTSTHNIMRFNSSNSLVACYASDNSGDQSPIVLYREVVGTQYTVTFDTGVEGLTVNSQTVEEGKKAKAPETLINGEKVAKSWYVLGDETKTPFNFETTAITQDITLVAIWEESTEKIVQFYDEDKTTLLGEKVVNAGKTTTAIDNPTKEGYEFDKWVDEEGNAFVFSTPITKMTKLYATYKNLDVTSIADVVREGSTTKYYRVEGEITAILDDQNFTISDNSGSILCFDKSKVLKISSSAKVGNKVTVTAYYSLFNSNTPEMVNFVASTFEIIESDEEVETKPYKTLESIDWTLGSEKLGAYVKISKYKLPAKYDCSAANAKLTVKDSLNRDVLLFTKFASLANNTVFKENQLVNIEGYTTIYNSQNEIVITSIEAYDVASEMANVQTIDWVSFSYKSHEVDGNKTYDSFKDVALNFSVNVTILDEPTLTEGGVIMLKGTSSDWAYESTLTALPKANNETLFVAPFKSMAGSQIGNSNSSLANTYTIRINFQTLENAKANKDTTYVIAPYFKVNDTYYIGVNKIETSLRKAIENNTKVECDQKVVDAFKDEFFK